MISRLLCFAAGVLIGYLRGVAVGEADADDRYDVPRRVKVTLPRSPRK